MNQTLILALGNDLIADDAIGFAAADALEREIDHREDLIICRSALSGLALLELMLGFRRAIIVDAVQTGSVPPGTILRFDPSELSPIGAPSPHFAGIPELIALARALELDFPEELEIVAVEAADLITIGGGLTPEVEAALPQLVDELLGLLDAEIDSVLR